MPDEALMTLASKDDNQAFETLVERHQNSVYRKALQMLKTQEDAWDVSQEIFIKVYNARRSYTENAKFTTWLYRIASNAIIDRIRQNKRKQKVVSVEDILSEPKAAPRQHHAHHKLALAEIRTQMSQALLLVRRGYPLPKPLFGYVYFA